METGDDESSRARRSVNGVPKEARGPPVRVAAQSRWQAQGAGRITSRSPTRIRLGSAIWFASWMGCIEALTPALRSSPSPQPCLAS